MINDYENAEWDPSGWSPVFDAYNELVGFTRLQLAVGKFFMARPVSPRWSGVDEAQNQYDVGTMQLLGQATRVVRERPDGSTYFAFRVFPGDGDPADLPNYFPI
ncbi:hypothetical protein [Reyranella sp.]|uniref:hypothetical protein n=1 Tax=Reyranella sp. TaxID=1929291 RepID=UPI002721348D|nr:hypothetical protein [Reyranella sp.]MDO8977549.1 hypothetical protein [Reyranella sp.]